MTIDRDERIFDLAKKGYSYTAIAAEVGCSTSTVSKVIKDALYLRDYSGWELKELTDEKLAAAEVKLHGAAFGGDTPNAQMVDRWMKVVETRMKMRGLLKDGQIVQNNAFVLPENLTPEQLVELARLPLLSEAGVVDGEVVSAGGEQSYDPPGD